MSPHHQAWPGSQETCSAAGCRQLYGPGRGGTFPFDGVRRDHYETCLMTQLHLGEAALR